MSSMMNEERDPQLFVLVMVLNILLWAVIIRLVMLWIYA